MTEGKPQTIAGIVADIRRGLDGLFPRREMTPEEIELRAEWAQAAEHEGRLAARRERYGRERRALAMGCSLAMLDVLDAQEARIGQMDKRIEHLDAEVRRLRSARR